jgi:outer membrane protein assembly factor BamB
MRTAPVGRLAVAGLLTVALTGGSYPSGGPTSRPPGAAASRAQDSAGDAAPEYLEDPSRTGYTSDDGVAPPLVRRWTHNFNNQLTYPLIADGRVFVGVVGAGGSNPTAYGDRVFALSLHTGRVLWRAVIPGPYYTAMLAYDQGRVFVVNWNGVVEALSASTGRLLWQTKAPGDHYADPPVAVDGTVYLVSPTSSRLDAINQRTGSFRWRVPAPTCGASIAVGSHRVYLDGCGHVDAYSLRQGKLLWERARGGSNPVTGVTGLGSELATNDGSATTSSGVSRSELTSAATGAQQGTFPYSYHPPAVAGHLLIVTPFDATYLEAVQTRGQPGNERWSHHTSAQFGQPLVIGRDVFVLNSSYLAVYDAATGQSRGSVPVPSGRVPVQNELPPAAMASAQGYLVVPDESALSVYTGAFNPAGRGVQASASPKIITYGTRDRILIQGRLGPELRRPGPVRIVLSAHGFSEPGRELATGRSFADGGFQFELSPPTRNTSYDVAPAHGSAQITPAEVFVYPRSHYSYRYDHKTGVTTATVKLRFDPGIRLEGQTGFLYLARVPQKSLERLGSGRITGKRGHGVLSVSFPQPSHVQRQDRILWCVHQMTRLGLGYPDTVNADCGAATISYR